MSTQGTAEAQPLDAGYLSFLELIKQITMMAGPAFTMGALVKTGMGAAKHGEKAAFATWEDFVSSAETAKNPIARFEGMVKHYGKGVFGLPKCPFAAAIKDYKQFVGSLPAEYSAVTDQVNRPSPTTEKLRVGHGAGVSPFCCVHQPIRSSLGGAVTIEGKSIRIVQLACKSGTGYRGYADKYMTDLGVDKALVDKVLDDHMCCYCVVVEE